MKPSTFDASGITILFVEDDDIARKIVGQILPLRFPGLTLLSAANGKDGLKLFHQCRPDIVITDINMPVMNGIKLASEIKVANPSAVIIFMTAYSDTSYLLKAIELGVDHYILKPIDHEKLFNVLKKSIKEISLARQVQQQYDHIRKLSRAIERSPNMVMITDAQGTVEYVNPKFSETTGFPPNEVIGQNIRVFNSNANPDKQYHQLLETINDSREWHGEMLNRKKGGELYWENTSISPIPNDTGEITHFVAIKEDITNRKKAEEEIRKLNVALKSRAAELEAANRELESFSHTVSHDLRTPLTRINLACQALRITHNNQLDEDSLDIINDIHDGSLQMNSMIDALLKFSTLSMQKPKRTSVNLSNIALFVTTQLQQLEPQRKTTIVIQDGIMSYCDPDLAKVALSNLLGNAWKYTKRKRAARIEFGTTERSGITVCFVSDNGIGFAADEANRIFDPFQRLHDGNVFEGFGIGLATVRRIVNRHGGIIWAEGQPGKGATFYFSLTDSSLSDYQEDEDAPDFPRWPP